MSKLYIVIVTFNPDVNHLHEMIEVLENSSCSAVIVDNGSNNFAIDNIYKNTKIIRLKDNYGIAAAQNIGVKYAIENNAAVIGFFDQDSNVSRELIEELVTCLEDEEVSVVAPRSIDRLTKEEYPSQTVGKLGFPRDIYTNGNSSKTNVDIVISSGTFAKREVFEKVGLFDESFFIDFVDVEWCLRCKKSGVNIWIIPNAVMEHHIGKKTITIGRIFHLNIHSPYRTYYKVRNPFLLYNKKLSFVFCSRQLLSAIIHNFFLLLDKNNGKEYRKYYFHGIIDGICKRGGKYETWH